MNDFKLLLQKENIKYNDEILEKLSIYYDFINQYNKHTNITRVKPEEIFIKHFLDSIMISKFIDLQTINNVIDVGSGAGFPGVVLKIFYPNIKLTLIDSNNKKTMFLKQLVTKLQLNNVIIVHDRAENYLLTHANEYDLCTSRSVAFIDIIIPLALPFITENGYLMLMKGNYSNEIEILKKYSSKLNIKSYELFNYTLPNSEDNRLIIKIRRNKKFNNKVNYSDIVKKSLYTKKV